MKFSHTFHCYYDIRFQKYHCIHSLETITDVCIYLGNVFYLQGNLETRSTENQGAMHSEATDVPVAEEGGSTEDKELNDGENIN
jgi:hypothetical protein